jgi:hypothetical protein
VGQTGLGTSMGLKFFLWKRKEKSSNGNNFFLVRIISAFKRVEFVRDMMLHMVL